MGDTRRPAGAEALDEMGRKVAAWLAALPAGGARAGRTARPLPDVTESERLLAAAADGWTDWRRRLEGWQRVRSDPDPGRAAQREAS